LKIKEFKWIPLNQLQVSDENIRKTLIDREKEALKRSIKKKGVLDVLTVVYNEDKQTYEIIKGQRRYLACKELKGEGFTVKELPCIVKEKELPQDTTEESLLDELERVAVDTNDTGTAIVKLVEYYGSINKVSQELGVAEDWLNYYLSHLSLNEPAPAIEAKENSVETPKSLEEYSKKEEPVVRTEKDPLAELSFEERKEAERRIQENPKIASPVVVSATRDWFENSRELACRYEEKTIMALSDWTKNPQPKQEITITLEIPGHDASISLRRALDIVGNELYKEYLRKIKFRT
jgi:ParB/RepB/Spo0J family partition protein